jgi:DNA-binding transcriptional LysR family regulator
MELQEIKYFLALSKVLNFTRAAEACNVTQPALTRAIQKMEEEMGGLLFSRERGNTHLTDLGRLLEPQFAEMLARAEGVKRTAARFLRLDGTQLNLGVMYTIGPMRFVGFLNQFRTNHPGIELTMVDTVPQRLTDMLIKGELDVAVMSSSAGFEAPLVASRLYEERFMVACSQNHRFAQKNTVTMTEMNGQTYLQRVSCEYVDVLRTKLTECGVDIERSYRSEREDWIQTMVVAGMGVCFLPEYSATLPGLVLRPVLSPMVKREVCLVTVAGRRWSSPVAAFVKAVRSYDWPVGSMPDLRDRAAEDLACGE